RPGVLARDIPRRSAGPAHSGNAGLGPLAGRIRADPDLQRRDAAQDRGVIDDRVSGTDRWPARGGARRIVADGDRGRYRTRDYAYLRPARHGTDLTGARRLRRSEFNRLS